jgi:hypothetical protein
MKCVLDFPVAWLLSTPTVHDSVRRAFARRYRKEAQRSIHEFEAARAAALIRSARLTTVICKETTMATGKFSPKRLRRGARGNDAAELLGRLCEGIAFVSTALRALEGAQQRSDEQPICALGSALATLRHGVKELDGAYETLNVAVHRVLP